MAKTASILFEQDWKSGFGGLIALIASEQGIAPEEIGRRLDRLPDSSSHNRAGDWSRYVNKGRIPTESQAVLLASVLRIPVPIMRLCAGYVDDIFECAYGLISGKASPPRRLPCSKTRAVFAFLFSLFPNEETQIGNVCELWSFIAGRPVRMNLDPDRGFMTGRGWNATWLYTHRPKPSDLIETRCDPKKDAATYVFIGKPRTTPWTEYSLQSKIQADLGSPLAATILACERVDIPKTDPLFEAQSAMHARGLPLYLRAELATTIVHHWANQIDEKTADEVRRDLHVHALKTLKPAAALWIKGKRPERPENDDFWL